MDIDTFRKHVWDEGHRLYRDMPWRTAPTFYNVLVSEIMLQQTQVVRVCNKFIEFMQLFPTIEVLATADLSDVLRAWIGLGYNRRAKFLHDAAKQLVMLDRLPQTVPELVRLPGIGPNTAGAIAAYTYNVPVPFVETNIRTVYIHHFFETQTIVHDDDIYEMVRLTLDAQHPREFYWALMDYGSWLKRVYGAHLRQSKQYVRQTPLAGSTREVRGEIIRLLKDRQYTKVDLQHQIKTMDERFPRALAGLQRDGLISITGLYYHLTK